MKTVAIIGAGLSGCTIARVLAENNIKCNVFEAEKIPGGLAADVVFDYPVSLYGPHIFHSNLIPACNFIFRFCELNNYIHRVKSATKIGYLNWPINLSTICKIFETDDVNKAKELWDDDIGITRDKCCLLLTFEQKIIHDIGEKVYDIMVKDYSRCQWGKFYAKLPVELFKRIKIVDSFDDKFFDDDIQGIPKRGYTALACRILDHPNISIAYGMKIGLSELTSLSANYTNMIISTAPPDKMLDYKFGKLEYQRIDFQTTMLKLSRETFYNEECMNVGVINFAYQNSIYTRMANYKRLACNEVAEDVIIAEKPGEGIVAYPIRTQENIKLAKKYIQYMKKLGVIQAGRLGLFEYTDMDEAIFRALNLAKSLLKKGV